LPRGNEPGSGTSHWSNSASVFGSAKFGSWYAPSSTKTGPTGHFDPPAGAPLPLGADGVSSLYEDDGKTFDYRKGVWMGITMTWRDADGRLALELTPGSRMLAPLGRAFAVRLAGTQATRSVVFEGKPLEVRLPR
jgi:hypothetical protein